MNFESEAELQAYPWIKKLADQWKCELEVQKRIYDRDYFKWVKRNGYDEDSYKLAQLNQQGYRTTYMFERYRLDFYLDFKWNFHSGVAIEIDGEQFHNPIQDGMRDEWMDLERNVFTFRIKAVDVFNGRIKELLEGQFGVKLE